MPHDESQPLPTIRPHSPLPDTEPPEQAIGAVDKIDRQSDVFGLGGILCAILTGKPPYIGETAESTRQLVANFGST